VDRWFELRRSRRVTPRARPSAARARVAPRRIFTESLGCGLAFAPQVGEVNASLVPARRLTHAE